MRHSRLRLLLSAAVTSVAGVAGLSSANAQSSSNEIVVTGSFIAGTSETAALPVEVIGVDELERRGNPSVRELIKNLSISSGVQGDSAQYTTGTTQPAGTATVNLRNLGPERGLVLMNGKRMVNLPRPNAPVDINQIPQMAIGRIEVLKDGAAATYGSDAIAGVINFITRKNFDGLQLSGAVRHVPDAESPDYEAGVLWGATGDNGNVLLSAGYQTRGGLRTFERDWNLRSYTENPDSGYSFTNNPTSFQPIVGGTLSAPTAANPVGAITGATISSQIRDPGCATVGAVAGFVGGNQVCLARLAGIAGYLVEPQQRLQLFGEANFDVTEKLKFHAEALYAESFAETQTSPSFPSTLGTPTSTTSPFAGFYYAPANNPGLALLMSQFPAAFPAGVTGVRWAQGLNFRPIGLGGQPLNAYEGQGTFIDNKSYRVTGGLSGSILKDAVNWDFSTTYHVSTIKSKGRDYLISRAELALRGFGSLAGDADGCTAAETANFTTNAGNNAIGCYWLNPFSNSFAANSKFFAQNPGAANPLFSPSVENNTDMLRWMFQTNAQNWTSRLFVSDLIFNGELPIEFSGGKVGWAAGAQYRRNLYRTTQVGFTDLTAYPCVDTPINGSKSCAVPVGPFSLQAANSPANLAQDAYAAFGELSLPLTDAIGAHLAGRFEDYGKQGGSTFNPKFDIRWQVMDALALRGSVGTTFRAPPLTLLDPAPTVSGAFLLNAFRAQSLAGNPDLKPEKATTYSLGAIVNAGPFKGTIDYWSFDFKDPFVPEPAATFFNAMFPNSTNVNCGNPAFADLQARFVFQPGTCDINNVTQINLSYINQGGIKTDGVDVSGEFTFDEILSGQVRVGATATYTNKYQVEAQVIQGQTVAPAFDAAGLYNYTTGYYALPKWKGNVYGEYEIGRHNVRLQVNYVDSYLDQRTTPFAGNLVIGNVATVGAATTIPRPLDGKTVKSYVTADVNYRATLPGDAMVAVAIGNILNQDPPLARMELNYDGQQASALGRTFKVTVSKTF